MHPHVKLHKLLRLVLYLISCIIMILCPVCSHSCNGGVRTVKLHSSFTGGYLRIEGKKISASDSINFEDHILQAVTLENHTIALYDPNANMFICWNKHYSNVIPRRNPRNMQHCKFEEKVSIKHPSSLVRYTSIYTQNGIEREAELKFNKYGNFSTAKFIRKCWERKRKQARVKEQGRHHSTYNFSPEIIASMNTKNLTSEMKKAYVHVTKYCADPDFVVQIVPRECDLEPFCEQMKRIKHPIACELSQMCKLTTNNKKCSK